MIRKSFIFYRSFYESVECLEEEGRARLLYAIIKYGLDGTESDILGVEKATFIQIKEQIDANNKRYLNGCKGGRKSKAINDFLTESEPSHNQTITKTEPNSNRAGTKSKPNDNDNENDNENDNDNDNEKVIKEDSESPQRSKKFKPPTLIEVKAYCAERGLQIDAERFIDYYTSNGWRIGNSPMKDWQATVRNWARRDISASSDRANMLPNSGDMSKYYS